MSMVTSQMDPSHIASFQSYVHALDLEDRKVPPRHSPPSEPLDASSDSADSDVCPIDSNSDSRVFGSLEQSSDSALRFGSAYNHLLVDSFISWKDPDYQPGTSDVEECPVIPHSQPVTNLAEKHLAFSPDSSESISTFIEANRVVSAESECGPCPQPASQAMNVAKKRGLFSRATKPNTVSVGDLSEMNESANGLAKAKGAPSSPSSVSGGIDSQDEDRFNGDGVMFHGKLIGHEYVAEARGEQMCQQSLKKLKIIQKAIGGHKRRIQLYISFDGIKIHDAVSTQQLFHHPVPQISFISRDETDTRAFGYVFGNSTTGHQFIGIKTKKEAMVVMSTIGQLFAITLKRKRSAEESAALAASCPPGTAYNDCKSVASDDHLYHSVTEMADLPPTDSILTGTTTRSRRNRAISASSENVPIPALPPPVADHRRHYQSAKLAVSSASSLSQPAPANPSSGVDFTEVDIFNSFESATQATTNHALNLAASVDSSFTKQESKPATNRLASSLAYDWAHFDDDKMEGRSESHHSQLDDSTLNTVSSISEVNLSSANTISANRTLSQNDSSTLVARSNQKNNAKNSSSTTIASSNFDGIDPFSDAFGDDPFSTASTTADISTANAFGIPRLQRPPSAASNSQATVECTSGSVPVLSNQMAGISLDKSTSSHKSNVELASSFNSTSSADRYAALADIHSISTSIFDSFGNKKEPEPAQNDSNAQLNVTCLGDKSTPSFSTNQNSPYQLSNSPVFGAAQASPARSTPNLFDRVSSGLVSSSPPVQLTSHHYNAQWASPTQLQSTQAAYGTPLPPHYNPSFTGSLGSSVGSTHSQSPPIDIKPQPGHPSFQELDPLAKSRLISNKITSFTELKSSPLKLTDNISKMSTNSSFDSSFSRNSSTPPYRRSPFMGQSSLSGKSTPYESQQPLESQAHSIPYVPVAEKTSTPATTTGSEDASSQPLSETDEPNQPLEPTVEPETKVTSSPMSNFSWCNLQQDSKQDDEVFENTLAQTEHNVVGSEKAEQSDLKRSSLHSSDQSVEEDECNLIGEKEVEAEPEPVRPARDLSRQSSTASRDVLSTTSSTPPAIPPRTDLHGSKFTTAPPPPPPHSGKNLSPAPPPHYSQPTQPMPPPVPLPYYAPYSPYSPYPSDIYADPAQFGLRRYNSPIRFGATHQLNWNSTYDYLYHPESGAPHYGRPMEAYGPPPHAYPYTDFYPHRQSPYSSLVYHSSPYGGDQFANWPIPSDPYYPSQSGPPHSHPLLHHHMAYDKSKASSTCSTPPPTGDLNTPPPPPLPNPQRRISAGERIYQCSVSRSNSVSSNPAHFGELSRTPPVSGCAIPSYPPPPPPAVPYYGPPPMALVDSTHPPPPPGTFEYPNPAPSQSKGDSDSLLQATPSSASSQSSPGYLSSHGDHTKYYHSLRRPVINYDTPPPPFYPATGYASQPMTGPVSFPHSPLQQPHLCSGKGRVSESQAPTANSCSSVSSNSSGSSGYSTTSRITPNSVSVVNTSAGGDTQSTLASYPYQRSSGSSFTPLFDSTPEARPSVASSADWGTPGTVASTEKNESIFEDNFSSLTFEANFTSPEERSAGQSDKSTDPNNNSQEESKLSGPDSAIDPPREAVKSEEAKPYSPPERNIFLQKEDPFEDDFFKS